MVPFEPQLNYGYEEHNNGFSFADKLTTKTRAITYAQQRIPSCRREIGKANYYFYYEDRNLLLWGQRRCGREAVKNVDIRSHVWLKLQSVVHTWVEACSGLLFVHFRGGQLSARDPKPQTRINLRRSLLTRNS